MTSDQNCCYRPFLPGDERIVGCRAAVHAHPQATASGWRRQAFGEETAEPTWRFKGKGKQAKLVMWPPDRSIPNRIASYSC